MSPKQRIDNLVDHLNHYAYEYYALDSPSVDDSVYDGLMAELKKLEEQNPTFVRDDSPTQRVGSTPSSAFKSVAHSQRMLSLNDVFSAEEARAWLDRITKLDDKVKSTEFFADIKKDGLACAIIYQDGSFTQAITRGDGTTGEDVTANVKTINTVPLSLKKHKGFEKYLNGRTEVRGEIVMYKAEFDKLNKARAKAGKSLFANPRNLAAGTIRQLDPKLVAARPLTFIPYDLIRDNPAEVPTNSQAYKALNGLGFIKNPHAKTISSFEVLIKFAESWQEKRHNLPYNTDGLVIKLNDRVLYQSLGVVGKNPRGAIAYKYPAEQTTTKVKDIFISIGRTGSATPVAMLEPVVIAGSTVQMATLHNEGEIARKDIRVGDTVVVQKAGDIIPEVVESLPKLRSGAERPFKMPKDCPECGTRLVKAKVNEAVWRCPNKNCPSRVLKQIQHFASKSALDIEGLGEKNVQALLIAGLINDVADIYTVEKTQLLPLERFADLSAQNLVDAISQKRQPSLERFLFGLGIRHVGVQTAIDLSQNFGSLNSIAKATIEKLHNVEGVGEVVAESIVAWFAEPSHQKLLDKFKSAGVWPKEAKRQKGPLTGISFVITGTLESMGREQAAERIRELGGTFQSSVGNDTTYLVAGANVGESKLEKAKKLNTKVISETELLKLIS